MKLTNEVKQLIEKINSGKLKPFLDQVDGSDFGLYISVYMEDNTIHPMKEGYTQSEENLKITIHKVGEKVDPEAKAIAWMGWPENNNSDCSFHKGSKCVHPEPNGPNVCIHCRSDHKGKCRHCHHGVDHTQSNLKAPELVYELAVEDLNSKKDLLKELEKEGFGLALLHGHSDEYMFTKLPEGYISVISDGVTSFRKETEIEQDPSFVPNVWRSINGKLRIAGGYSNN